MINYYVLVTPLITLLLSLIIMFDIATFRFSRKKMVIITSIELVALFVLNGGVIAFAGLQVYAAWYVLIIVIPPFTIFFFTSIYRDARDIFTILLIIFISFFTTIPALWFAFSMSNQYLSYNIARVVIFFLVFFIIHKFFRKPYMLLQSEVVKGWGVFSFLPLIGSGVLYYEFLQYSMKGDFVDSLSIISITVLMMIFVFVMILYMFKQLHEKYMIQEQQRILQLQNKAQLDQFTLFKEDSEKSNRRWHDLRHNTQGIIEILEQGDADKAIMYLKESMEMRNIPHFTYCAHPAVNSILCLWAERCMQENILFEVMTTFPEILEIEPMELSALFSNAIENGYNSCLDLPKDSNRYIKVEAQYNGKRLAVGVTNTCVNDVIFEGGMPVSQREGGGIGTRSMVYTIKRFQGAYTFEAHDGLFFTRFVLNV